MIPFRAGHVSALRLQAHENTLARSLSPQALFALEGPDAHTVVAEGQMVACLGVLPLWPGTGEAWAFLAHDCGRHLLWITRAIERYLRHTHYTRVQCMVAWDFWPAHRWCKRLGFTLEAPRLRQYADGKDYSLYARVRE